MLEIIKPHLRLILLTGLASGLAVIFLLMPPAAGSRKRLQPAISTQIAKELAPKAPSYKFPDGGQALFPNHRLVALYGIPGVPALGSLGEQDIGEATHRVKQLAEKYQKYSDEPVLPVFEIITTIASAGATENGDYSSEIPAEKLKPWIDAAHESGIYVVLDLQPGLSDFLTQAKSYETLLKEPHVGLALDPEWRLAPGQRHMKQIGSVHAGEVNQTASWLADLVRDNGLPQKLLLIHQFKLSMIIGREALDASRHELAWLIQMDGLGAQNVKLDTWRTITGKAPSGIYFGWKNFIDEDKPMLNPEQTMQIDPKPYFVSYQ